ncbi:MAG: hypothetical protein ACOYNZ_02010 [Rhodoferax sp.]
MVKKVVEKASEQTSGQTDPAVVVHLYAATDPIPVPEAVESDTDTAWALWEDLSTEAEQEKTEADSAFALTVPDTLSPLPATGTPKKRR